MVSSRCLGQDTSKWVACDSVIMQEDIEMVHGNVMRMTNIIGYLMEGQDGR